MCVRERESARARGSNTASITLTASHPLHHTHCITLTATHLLQHTHCSTHTATHTLQHTHCNTLTATHTLPRRCRNERVVSEDVAHLQHAHFCREAAGISTPTNESRDSKIPCDQACCGNGFIKVHGIGKKILDLLIPHLKSICFQIQQTCP